MVLASRSIAIPMIRLINADSPSGRRSIDGIDENGSFNEFSKAGEREGEGFSPLL